MGLTVFALMMFLARKNTAKSRHEKLLLILPHRGPSKSSPFPRPLLFPVSWYLPGRVFEERGAQWWVFTASRVRRPFNTALSVPSGHRGDRSFGTAREAAKETKPSNSLMVARPEQNPRPGLRGAHS